MYATAYSCRKYSKSSNNTCIDPINDNFSILKDTKIVRINKINKKRYKNSMDFIKLK